MRRESPGACGQRSSGGASTGVITGMKARNGASWTRRGWMTVRPNAPRGMLLWLASSTSTRSPDGGAIPECEAYASRYEACLSASGTREVAHSSRQTLALAGLLLGVLLLLGCGSRANGGDGETNPPIEECDAFVAAYAHCLGTLGPERIAQARVQQTRTGLATQVQSAHGDAARTALRKQCADNLSQLKATCH